MKRVYFIFAISLLMSYLLLCQERYFLPGETQELRDQIQTEVHNQIGTNQNLGMILNIDSCIGFGWKIKYPPMGEVGNPYGTLTHCIIFVTNLQGYPTPTDSASGVIGVFKDGNIIWHSNGAITVKYDISSDCIWCVKDINNDGKVEILVDWREGLSSQGLMNLWIVRWDGTQGQIINDKDGDGFSTIRTSGSWDFNLADIEGDGVWEIQGAMEPKSSSVDTLRKIPNSDYSLYTYSWNGSFYGLWQSTPQPLYGASYPRNKAQVDVSASTRQNGNVLDYNYKVHNLNSSFQFVEEFAIDRLVDTVKFNSTRNFWKGYTPWLPVVEWWCSGSYGVNYIQPGETEPSFSFTTVTSSLPKILNFYSFGLNKGASSRMKRSLNNSFRGFTIGPATPPSPFIPIAFLDTLTSYTTQSRSLGWIKDQTTTDKYLGYFGAAKTSLQQNNIIATCTTLQQVLADVNVDSTIHLTSEAYALIRYNTEYLLAQLPTAPLPSCIVKLINSTGSLLTNGTLQYRDSTWKDAINNNDGTFTITTSRKKLNLRMTYEYGTQTKSNVIVGTDTIVFQTVKTQIQLKNSQGGFIDTGIVQYYAEAWRIFGTTTNGITTKELLPKKYTFRMTYDSASISKAQNIDSNATVVFQTVPTTVQLLTSTGVPLDTGIVQYYFAGWKDFGTTTNGVVTKELLPIKCTFKMTYNNASNEKKQNIDSSAVVVFQTVNASVQLKNSSGNLIDQGVVQYNSGGWKDFGITSNGSVQKELLPAKYNFKMTYASASKNQAQDLDSNAVVVFQTSNVSVQLKNSLGNPLDTGIVQYNAGGWKDFGTTVNGIANKELLPVKYTFRMTFAGANNDKAQNTDSNAVVTFQTVNAVVQLQNSKGSLMDTGTVQYNAGGWRTLGITVNGVANKELLPNKYTFRMAYAYANKDQQQDLSSNSTVVFQTVNAVVQLQNSQGISLDTGIVQYNAGGWKSFGTTANGIASKELLANKYNFRMTYAFVNNEKVQNLDSSNTVSFSTVLCTVRVTNSLGQVVNNAIVTYNASGYKSFGTTVNGITTKELLPANITFRVQSGKTTQTKAQDITTNPNVEFNLP